MRVCDVGGMDLVSARIGNTMSVQIFSRVIAAVLVSGMIAGAAHAAPGGQGKGSGNANGNGWYNNNGGGGAAPLPLVGVTLMGQAAGAAGLAFLWHRRRRNR